MLRIFKKFLTVGIFTCVLAVVFYAQACAFTVHVIDDNGNPVNGFRYTVELDNTYGPDVKPMVPNPNANYPAAPTTQSLGVNIHRTHAPVVITGNSNGNSSVNIVSGTDPQGRAYTINPASRYYVSVLPDHTSPIGVPANAQTGFTMSGRLRKAGQNDVTITVHAFPVPSAQITILAFQDNQPINGAYDQPAEAGLPGFSIQMTDPIGLVMQDAFGNPLGTTYKLSNPADPNSFVIDPATGLPVPDYMGTGALRTCPTGDPLYDAANCVHPDGTPMSAGEAVVRFLPANKYTIELVPPSHDPNWILTATLEGTRSNDAWVRAKEPRFNIILGQLNWLVFYGFVRPMDMSLPGGGHTISGRVVSIHDAHPPQAPGLSPGLPVPDCYVGLNNLNGNDEQVYTAPCNSDSTFSIPRVPDGTYQLVMWDKPIDTIIDFRNVTVAGSDVNLHDVAVYRWFGTFSGSVFNDTNGNGKKDPGEKGIPNEKVNIRYTDGSIFLSKTTDPLGNYNFAEVITFWRFLIPEVDMSSPLKPTGMTSVVDDGGPISGPYAQYGINPQIQPDGNPFRTQTGRVTTQASYLMADMNNMIDWGKKPYGPHDPGSIYGMALYDTTRTEEDPRFASPDPWETGVPDVPIKLWRAVKVPDTVLDPTGQLGIVTWQKAAVALKTTRTSRWDTSQPTGCVGGQYSKDPLGPIWWPLPEVVNGHTIRDCAETFRIWGQTRPGVYDGRYEFDNVLPGEYIVESVTPIGYRPTKWGDRNIEFGDPYKPNLLLYPPECVGDAYQVPLYHTLFPDQQVPTDYYGQTLTPDPAHPGLSTTWARSCEQKHVTMHYGNNQPTDFNMFTEAPKAARIWGTVWNDLQLEFDPRSPNAGGNLGVSYLPVSIRDYNGNEVARSYTDQWGHFDILVPSNYDINPPIPLGLKLSMLTINPNDLGPIPDGKGGFKVDPFFNPAYARETIRENWEFYPGKTTFVDTIVIPIAGFTANRVPLNCDYLNYVPEIFRVDGPTGGPVGNPGDSVMIQSVAASTNGIVQVPNPDWDPSNPSAVPATIARDHSFGPSGAGAKVEIVTDTGATYPLTISTWNTTLVSGKVPAGAQTGQLVVTRADGMASQVGVTFHVSPTEPVIHVHPPSAQCTGLACAAIQPAIDAAPNNALILVEPGSYQEWLIMYKPVKLQGYGAESTINDGTLALGNLDLKNQWISHIAALNTAGWISLPPGVPNDFQLLEGAVIMALGCDPSAGCPRGNQFTVAKKPLIDGMTFTGGSESGSGVSAESFVSGLQVSNCDIWGNEGTLAGGVRIGTPNLTKPDNTGSYGSGTDHMIIAHNRIALNGSLMSSGGGIALYTGSDYYKVSQNLVCGNHAINYGGGLAHYGLSPNGLIQANTFISNESNDEGGGIQVGGELVPAAAPPGTLTQGSGPVKIVGNLIQGNLGGGDGGGIRFRKVNGQDVVNNPGNVAPVLPTDPPKWSRVEVFNNMIVNNTSAHQGGGIALDDTVDSIIIHNTIAHNDSTATGSDAFGGPCSEALGVGQICPPPGENLGGLVNSIPAVGGISSAAHSTDLQVVSGQLYPDPVLADDIIWQNRSYYWNAMANNQQGAIILVGYWDMTVYGVPGAVLHPTYSILTDGVGGAPNPSNQVGTDPRFVKTFFNKYSATSKGQAFGNYVNVTFVPNGLSDAVGMFGDYHIMQNSPAVDMGDASYLLFPELANDIDAQSRPHGAKADVGADEWYLNYPLPF